FRGDLLFGQRLHLCLAETQVVDSRPGMIGSLTIESQRVAFPWLARIAHLDLFGCASSERLGGMFPNNLLVRVAGERDGPRVDSLARLEVGRVTHVERVQGNGIT